MIPHPTATGFDPANALALARLAKLAYPEPGESEAAWQARVRHVCDRIAFPEIEVRFLSSCWTDTQGFMAVTASAAVIVFRGTSPTKLRDWLTDLNARKVDDTWGRTHLGFAKAIVSIEAQLVDAYRALVAHRQPVWITGHSLGGALAQIALPIIARIDRELPRGIVFGSPRVGDAGWRSEFNTLFQDRFWRVEMAADPVPWVPTLLMGYRGAGQRAFIDDGRILINPPWWRAAAEAMQRIACSWPQRRLALLPNHFMDRYVAALEQINDKETRS